MLLDGGGVSCHVSCLTFREILVVEKIHRILRGHFVDNYFGFHKSPITGDGRAHEPIQFVLMEVLIHTPSGD